MYLFLFSCFVYWVADMDFVLFRLLADKTDKLFIIVTKTIPLLVVEKTFVLISGGHN